MISESPRHTNNPLETSAMLQKYLRNNHKVGYLNHIKHLKIQQNMLRHAHDCNKNLNVNFIRNTSKTNPKTLPNDFQGEASCSNMETGASIILLSAYPLKTMDLINNTSTGLFEGHLSIMACKSYAITLLYLC